MHAKNYLLVNPWVHDFKCYDEWMQPLALYRIGHHLQENAHTTFYLDLLGRHSHEKKFGTGDYPYEIIDKPKLYESIPRSYKRYGISQDKAESILINCPAPDGILVTSLMSYWYPGVIETIRWLKAHYPGTPIHLGGIYATLCHEHASQYSGADYVHEGKWNKEDFTRLTGSAPHEWTLGWEYPYPVEKKFLPLLVTEGCPYNCSYCSSQFLFNGLEMAPHGVLLDALAHAWDAGCRDATFYDEALLLQFNRRLLPLLEKLSTAGYAYRFHTPNGVHARVITAEVAAHLHRFGFQTICLGLESSKPALLSKSNNKTSYDLTLRAIRNLKQVGFSQKQIRVYLIYGFEGQPAEWVRDDIEFVLNEGGSPRVNFLSPVPHTEIFNEIITAFPEVAEEPLTHNDLYFLFGVKGYNWVQAMELRHYAKQHTLQAAQV